MSKVFSSGKRAKRKHQSGGAAGFLRDLLMFAVVYILLTMFVGQPFAIPSTSMMPGLLVGDRFIALKYSYGYSRYSFYFSPNLFSGRILAGTPERGDVVVFRLPSDPKVDYIKRVIGLPGDRVRVSGGRLIINGKTIERRAVAETVADDMGSERRFRVFEETLPNGRKYRIYHLADGNPPGNNTPEYVVPDGHYFMMGDNRDNSCDSRFSERFDGGGMCPTSVGYVPFENFVGRASFMLFSLDAELWELWKWPVALRYSRFLMGVQ